MKIQKQTMVLAALLVLAVASVTLAEEPVENIVSKTCKIVVEQAGPRVAEMCKQAIKAKAIEAVCTMLKACTSPGLLESLLKMGGLFG